MKRDGRHRQELEKLIFRPVRASALPAAIVRSAIGWNETPHALQALLELEYAVSFLEGYLCKEGNN